MGLLDGKVAIITGAGSGIGAASAQRFAEEGAAVAVADVRGDAAAAVADEIVAAGGRAIAVTTDVTSPEDVERMVAHTVEHFGALHVMWANAGVLIAGRVDTMSLATWQRHFDVNVTGGFLCAKYALPAIVAAGGGAMLFTGSSASFVAEPNDVAYVASKGAVLMLAKALAVDHVRSGVRVNCICPGWIDTPFNDPLIDDPAAHAALVDAMIPAGRQGVPAEVAEAAVFLVSDRASYVNGQAFLVDGGFTAV